LAATPFLAIQASGPRSADPVTLGSRRTR